MVKSGAVEETKPTLIDPVTLAVVPDTTPPCIACNGTGYDEATGEGWWEQEPCDVCGGSAECQELKEDEHECRS